MIFIILYSYYCNVKRTHLFFIRAVCVCVYFCCLLCFVFCSFTYFVLRWVYVLFCLTKSIAPSPSHSHTLGLHACLRSAGGGGGVSICGRLFCARTPALAHCALIAEYFQRQRALCHFTPAVGCFPLAFFRRCCSYAFGCGNVMCTLILHLFHSFASVGGMCISYVALKQRKN